LQTQAPRCQKCQLWICRTRITIHNCFLIAACGNYGYFEYEPALPNSNSQTTANAKSGYLGYKPVFENTNAQAAANANSGSLVHGPSLTSGSNAQATPSANVESGVGYGPSFLNSNA